MARKPRQDFSVSKLHTKLQPLAIILPQIVKGEHFRGREVRGYEWDFEISGLGGLLSLLIFVAEFCTSAEKSMYLLVVERLVLCECCFAWMLWKLGRIDGDPVLRETRIWATWEYVSSAGGGQQGMVGLCAHCGCGKTCCAPSPDRHLVPHVMEWYLEICRGGQETLGTSGGVLLPKTKLDQSRPNPGIVGQLENEVRKLREPLIVMAAQLIRDRVEMECLEGAWETLKGNTRCRFRGTIRFTATSLVHPDEPARTLQRTVEWTTPWIRFVYLEGGCI
ncbi:hypothetical protein D0Y65_026618 [Glycine soja]|uniref:Uncharacterized protein n=1 Tax=Glycine soja TaxID=3848 RepID=A0A445IKM8_GLYSO|nr:hypothetical protein D0Y65_026618 [Glycine soja]